LDLQAQFIKVQLSAIRNKGKSEIDHEVVRIHTPTKQSTFVLARKASCLMFLIRKIWAIVLYY